MPSKLRNAMTADAFITADIEINEKVLSHDAAAHEHHDIGEVPQNVYPEAVCDFLDILACEFEPIAQFRPRHCSSRETANPDAVLQNDARGGARTRTTETVRGSQSPRVYLFRHPGIMAKALDNNSQERQVDRACRPVRDYLPALRRRHLCTLLSFPERRGARYAAGAFARPGCKLFTPKTKTEAKLVPSGTASEPPWFFKGRRLHFWLRRTLDGTKPLTRFAFKNKIQKQLALISLGGFQWQGSEDAHSGA